MMSSEKCHWELLEEEELQVIAAIACIEVMASSSQASASASASASEGAWNPFTQEELEEEGEEDSQRPVPVPVAVSRTLGRGRFLGLLTSILGFRKILEEITLQIPEKVFLLRIFLNETFENGCNPFLALIHHLREVAQTEMFLADSFRIQTASTCFQELLKFEASTQDLELDWLLEFRAEVQDFLTFLVSTERRSSLLRQLYANAQKDLDLFRPRTLHTLVQAVQDESTFLKLHPEELAPVAHAPLLLSALRDLYNSVKLFSDTDKKGAPKELPKPFKRSKSEIQVKIPCPEEKLEKSKWKAHLLKWKERLRDCTAGLSLTREEFCNQVWTIEEYLEEMLAKVV